MRYELMIERGGNAVIGNYWRVSAYAGESYAGEQIYAGYTKAQARELAKDTLEREGGLGLYRKSLV